MKFYDREKELEMLQRNWEQSAAHSIMTTLTGRRRVGKTSLILRSLEKHPHVYLYVSKDNEQVLCQRFLQEIQKLEGLQLYGQPTSFSQVFELLMKYGKEHCFTLVIDEFQNFLSINKAIPSHMQDIWDRYKDHSHVNLILCGSIYSMMRRIFENSDEPLYGRRDSNMLLLPFSVTTIKEILTDHNPDYMPDDLLCLYMLTGGVAKYVSLLMDAHATNKEKMLDFVFREDSPFLTEGRELMLSEFGRDYGTYFSIMQLIAEGKTSQTEIDSIIGKNTGTYLKNLYEEYRLITRNTPLLSSPGARNIKWQIDDQFLRFWFRFIHPYQNLIESRQLSLLRAHVNDCYDTFTGKTLENYFHKKMMQSGQFTKIGNWWDRKGLNENDMIAINEFSHQGVVAEIKRNPKRISLHILEEKAKALPKEFNSYTLNFRALSIEDL